MKGALLHWIPALLLALFLGFQVGQMTEPEPKPARFTPDTPVVTVSTAPAPSLSPSPLPPDPTAIPPCLQAVYSAREAHAAADTWERFEAYADECEAAVTDRD